VLIGGQHFDTEERRLPRFKSEKNREFSSFLLAHFSSATSLLVVTKCVVQYTYEDNEADNSLTIDGEPEPETVPEQQTDVPTEAENNTDDDDANNDEDPHHHLPIGLALLTLLGKTNNVMYH
jgi:hypothetical protein